jgi:ferredoxin
VDGAAVAVLLAAGVAVETGCQTGGCGSCVLAYVEGDLIHKDSCLSAADRARYFCPCVSRARTRVVLAL